MKRAMLYAIVLVGVVATNQVITEGLSAASQSGTEPIEIWVERYNGIANSGESAAGITVDGIGNVYISGTTGTTDSGNDWVTIKYDSSGNELWMRSANGPDNYDDLVQGIALDDSQNVIVCGDQREFVPPWSSRGHMAIIKYDSYGNEMWMAYDDSTGFYPFAMTLDADGNIFVVGGGPGTGGSNTSCFTVKCDPSGNILWTRRYYYSYYGFSKPHALVTDPSGNVYVTLEHCWYNMDWHYLTLKYDPQGNELWARRWDAGGYNDDEPSAMCIDRWNNIYVTGWCEPTYGNRNYGTVKYDSLGNELWARQYDREWSDEALGIAVDPFGNCYVTGWSNSAETSRDIVTIKYDSSGIEKWVRVYDGASNGEDRGSSVHTDGLGNVYVAGYETGDSGKDYILIMYDSDGNLQWVRTYDGDASDSDEARAIFVSNTGKNLYVSGNSVGSGTGVDIATIKYARWYCGDADASGGIDIDDVVHLINYIFAGGPAPAPLESGDADCSGSVDIDDVVYLINYIFAGGPAPCDPDGDGVPDC